MAEKKCPDCGMPKSQCNCGEYGAQKPAKGKPAGPVAGKISPKGKGKPKGKSK